MANVLHRLSVRAVILSALRDSIPGLKVVSREVGHIDVTANPDTPPVALNEALEEACQARGIEYDPQEMNVDANGQSHVRFTNSLMAHQYNFGARGFSKTARQSLGVPDFPVLEVPAGQTEDDDPGGSPVEPEGEPEVGNEAVAPTAEQEIEQALVAAGLGEVEPEVEPEQPRRSRSRRHNR